MAEKLFFPYRYADNAVELEVAEVRLDGRVAERLVDNASRAVVLRGLENWREAEFTVRARVAQDRLVKLFPDDEQQDPPCRMMLLAHCDATRWRNGALLEPTGSAGEWQGTLTVSRGGVRGGLLASAMLVRTRTRSEAVRPFGSRANTRLASSAEWRISFDRQMTPPGGYMNILWDDFANSLSEKRKSNASLLYYLDLEGEDPILYLNRGVPGLKEVLSSEATTGEVAAIRDTTFSAISQAVWLAMATDSLLSVPLEGNEPEKPWQRAVVGTLLPLLSGIDPIRAIRNPDEAPLLVEALARAVQTHQPLRPSVVKLLAEIESDDPEA